MFKKSIIAGLAVTAIFTAMASSANAAMDPYFEVEQENVLINNPNTGSYQSACWGCISPSTGRFRDGYVTPHFRSNGSFVSGYWRS
jgi:hypothetical protein